MVTMSILVIGSKSINSNIKDFFKSYFTVNSLSVSLFHKYLLHCAQAFTADEFSKNAKFGMTKTDFLSNTPLIRNLYIPSPFRILSLIIKIRLDRIHDCTLDKECNVAM